MMIRMRNSLGLLSALGALLMMGRYVCDEEAVSAVELDASNFEKLTNESMMSVVMFYAPWCGHCKSFKPGFEMTCARVHASFEKVLCGRVDCTTNEDICQKYNLTGYPTLRRLHDGRSCTYSGPRQTEALFSWVESSVASLSGSGVIDLKFAQKFLERHTYCVIGFFPERRDGTLEPPLKELVNEVSCSSSNVDLLVISDASVAEALGLDVPDTLGAFHGGVLRRSIVVAADAAELARLMFFSANPLVPAYTQESAHSVFSNDVMYYLLLVHGSTSSPLDSYVPALEQFAEAHFGEVRTFTVDSAVPDNSGVVEYFKAKSDGPHLVAFYNDATGKFFHYPDEGPIIPSLLAAFVTGCRDGTINPYIKRQPIPEGWDAKPVKELVADNFHKVLELGKTLVVLFYVPWCGHCQTLKPIWEKVGDYFEQHQQHNILVAQFDHSENELSHVEITSYPTIIVFRNDNERILYTGARTFDDIVDFAIHGLLKPDSPQINDTNTSGETAQAHEEL